MLKDLEELGTDTSVFLLDDLIRRSPDELHHWKFNKIRESIIDPTKFEFHTSSSRYADAIPDRVSVRQFDIKINNKKVIVSYSHGARSGTFSVPQNRGQLETLMDNDLNKDNFGGKTPMNSSRPSYPGETSLSINSEDTVLVVIRISKNLSVQFNRYGVPFSFGQTSVGYIGEVGKVGDSGAIINETELFEYNDAGDLIVNDDCQTAYFVAKGADGRRIGFNMHLDLVGGVGSSPKYYIPIVIDPDVRHPGGGTDP